MSNLASKVVTRFILSISVHTALYNKIHLKILALRNVLHAPKRSSLYQIVDICRGVFGFCAIGNTHTRVNDV